MRYDDETINALAGLRKYAATYPTMGLSGLINTLDNAGVFASLDEQTEYASAEDILSETYRAGLEAQAVGRHRRIPVDEPLVGAEADRMREALRPGQGLTQDAARALFGDTTPMERIPGTDILRPAHEHVFRSPHPDEVCYAVEWCTLTYGEHRARTERTRVCGCGAVGVHGVDHED
jgi:hypothetical protein